MSGTSGLCVGGPLDGEYRTYDTDVFQAFPKPAVGEPCFANGESIEPTSTVNIYVYTKKWCGRISKSGNRTLWYEWH